MNLEKIKEFCRSKPKLAIAIGIAIVVFISVVTN